MKIKYSSAYRKDRKKCEKRHWDVRFLDRIIAEYAENGGFTDKQVEEYYDHPLKGRWKGHREFHPYGHNSDWVVIYHLEGTAMVLDNTSDEQTLMMDRTGSHSDVFSSKLTIGES